MIISRKGKISILICVDTTIIIFAYLISFMLLSKYDISSLQRSIIIKFMPAIIGVYFFSLSIFKMYKSIWSSAGVFEATHCFTANIVAILIESIMFKLAINRIPEELIIAAGIIIMVLTITARLSLRVVRRIIMFINSLARNGRENILIIGAGECGETIINEIRKEKYEKYNIVGIIDDNKNKKNTYLNGIKILGNRNDINKVAKDKEVKLILFAIAKICNEEKKKIIEICNLTGIRMKVIPGMYELIDDELSLYQMRDINLKDLLGREEVILDKSGISDYIQGKVVLVTGGGGSIGSELCRQIAKYNPKKLLILDIYENNVYEIKNELEKKFINLNKEILIASIRDKARLNEIFNKYRPQIVFHAAAHKHVPLMEGNPSEAIKNNVVGTLNVAKCSHKYKVEKFVFISTDKAVNPTNVMGATKRICEMIIQAINKESDTEYVAVRFGNVLGSNGSVIPLFQRQIKEGGPITLTHKNITRFFMLIPEAAQLVLQAGAFAKGGEIFVLDMGKPVKIYDLAENLIRLSGYSPHKDIEIKIIGLRPGEKLYEELLMNNNQLRETNHKKIFIDKPEEFLLSKLTRDIEELMFIVKKAKKEELISKIREIVPTYITPEEHARRNSYMDI